MLQYEFFRQSLIGWAAVGTLIWLDLPLLKISASNTEVIAIVLVGFASTPVFGYLVAQLNRAYYSLSRRRPNEVDVAILELHTAFHQITGAATFAHKALLPLRAMGPKDLHRLMWVAYASDDVRDRSESYWERYFSNVCIVIAIAIGVIATVPVALTQVASGESPAIDTRLVVVTLVKLFMLGAIGAVLLFVRITYRRIATGIENAWMRGLIEELRQNPGAVAASLFKSA